MALGSEVAIGVDREGTREVGVVFGRGEGVALGVCGE